MSGVNLNKNGAEMQRAWKAVLESENPVNWALFGYEDGGSSNVLRLLGTGEDGLDEMREDLNCNKIMYAFVRVTDPKKSIGKFVLINWQGESAPCTRKGTCATHFRDIVAYFRGAHLTLNARNEDDIDLDEILQQVAKSSVAASSEFNFKSKIMTEDEDEPPMPEPVGTNHKRIIPQRELPDLKARENFWLQEEEKEKRRLLEEKAKVEAEAAKLEAERRAREERENKTRDEFVKDRERKISRLRASEEQEGATKERISETERRKWEEQLKEDRKEAEERNRRGESMKAERAKEAQELIRQQRGSAVMNPKAVFERNSSAGQMNYRKPKQPQQQQQQQQHKQQQQQRMDASEPEIAVLPPPESFGNDEDGGKVVEKPQPPDIAPLTSQPDLIADVTGIKIGPDLTTSAEASAAATAAAAAAAAAAENETVAAAAAVVAEGVETPRVTKDPQPSNEYGICAVALYDYEATDETEISFDPNQVITHIDKVDPGWWQGLGPDGNYGLFPANYVEIVDASQITQMAS